MRNNKLVILLLPLLTLAGCKGGEQQKSLYKEVLTNWYVGGEIVDTDKFVYDYDENGNEILGESYAYDFETKEFKYMISIKTSYDGDKQLKEEYYEADEEGKKVLVGYYKSTYNDDLKVKYESFDVDDGKESLYEYSLFFYDESNREIKVETFEADEETGEFAQVGLTETAYVEDSLKPSKVTDYIVDGEKKEVSCVTEYQYDEKGNVVSELEDDVDWGKSCLYFSYNDAGEITSYASYVFDEVINAWSIIEMSDYIYVDGIYEIEGVRTSFENGVVTKVSYETSEYDEDMNIVSSKIYNVNLVSNEYTLLQESTYSY